MKKKKKLFLYKKCCDIFGEKNFIGVSATNSWEKSRSFRYGMPKDSFEERAKITAERGVQRPNSCIKVKYVR